MADDDDAEIARLAALPTLDYERERDKAAERLGCRVPILDQLVATARERAGIGDSGAGQQPAPSANAEPRPEPVDGAALLDGIVTEIQRYVVLRRDQAETAALWAVASHAFDVFWIFPRMFVTAPERGCGKTTLLDVLSRLVPRPVVASNITAAALFRIIERDRPVLLLDEADSYARNNEDLRGVLNAGHRRDGAVVRCVGDDHEPRSFSALSPVALAAIGNLPGTIEDRSIKLNLRRRRPDELVEALRLDRTGHLEILARAAARWAADHAAELGKADPVMAGMVNRAAGNWRPLLSVADAVGGEWPERGRHAALALARDGSTDTDAPGVMLLADLREMFDRTPSGVLFTPEILKALYEREDRPWSDFRAGKGITARQIAQLLKAYGLTTNQTVRRGPTTGKGYRAKDLTDAWSRYLPPPGSVTRSQAPDTAASSDPGSVTPGGNVTGEGG